MAATLSPEPPRHRGSPSDIGSDHRTAVGWPIGSSDRLASEKRYSQRRHRDQDPTAIQISKVKLFALKNYFQQKLIFV